MTLHESASNVTDCLLPSVAEGPIRPAKARVQVAHLVLELSVGGLERAVVHLANGLAARAVRSRIIILEGDKYNSLTLACELDPDVEIHDLTGPLLEKMVKLRELTKGCVVHLHFWGAQTRPLYQLALLGRRVIATFQNDYTEMVGPGRVRWNRLCAFGYEAVIAVSPTVREYCISGMRIPERLITTIHNTLGPPPPAWRPRVAPSDRPLHVITVARLTAQKNVATLLQGIAAAISQGTACMLSLVGDGPEMVELVLLANRLNLRPHLQWYGELWPVSVVQSLLGSADIFVNASVWEGNPIAVLEAAAAGLPLVLSDIAPHHQIGQEDALYFDPSDASALAAQIIAARKCCPDSARRDRCRTRTLDRFSTATVVDLHLAKYRLSPSTN